MKSYILWIILLLSLIFTVIPTIAQEEAVGLSAEEIAAYPEPNVIPLTVNPNLLYDRAYRRVEGDLTIYDAPNGNLLNDYGLGYNYVTLSGAMQQGDWAQIGDAQWIPSSSLAAETAVSRYAGVLLPEEGLAYPMAWTLRHLYPSVVAGGEASENNPFLYRYTRVSIYATVEVDGFNWYQIGENQWVHQFNVAKILPVARPDDITTEKWVSVDLYEQVVIAYEGNTPVFSTLISSGLEQWATHEGTFNVYWRTERTRMSGGHRGDDFYYLEEVPWTMFFDGDIALHGTFWHDGFGYRQSRGCVNMSITDANWLFEWSADVKDWADDESVDLAVYVYSSGEYD
jgi:L,D-transpeptidase-like protein